MLLTQELSDRLSKTKAIPLSATPDPARDFLQVKLFHRALNAPAVGNPRERLRAVIQVPEIDFHEMVSTLGDYPELMRRIGLVIDLEIARPPGLPVSTRVWVEPTWQQSPTVTTKNVTPKTKCTVQGGFAAQPKDGEIISGMLRLRDPSKPPDAQPYDVVQVDLDGAAQKTMDHADNVIRKLARQDLQRATATTTARIGAVARSVAPLDADGAPPRRAARSTSVMRRLAAQRRAVDTSDKTSLPSMRSGGVSLVRHGRAMQLVATLRTARVQSDAITANPSADITLYAEDLARGYRADVYDGDSGKWRTLCARVGRYAFRDGGTTLAIEDEGWISQASTEAADGSSSDLHIPESLFRWTGWSLVAPRPGKRLGLNDIPEDYENTAETEFGLAVSYRPAPGSLPRLRFGPQYRLRARAVDLAGNGLTLEEADALMSGAIGQRVASEVLRYLRFEPVPSPVTVLRQSIKGSPGESLERLVIRSFNDSPPKDRRPSTASTERHIAAPLGAQLLAEHHGMFDTPTGLDANAYNTIIQREGILLVGNDAKEEQAHPEAQLAIPYLPDPLSRGASLLGLPGAAAAKATRVEFSGRWPDAMPFRIKIVDGNAPPKWDPGPRVLTVAIPKAEMARVRLSSYLNEEDVRAMGLWGWMNEAGESRTKTASLLRLSSEGRHWMIAPFRELVLVHAVQQPLIIPELRNLAAGKAIGATFADLSDEFAISGKSTAKVDLLAEWREPIDALSEPEWQSVPGKTHVSEIPVEDDADDLELGERHEFGDTKHRRVTYAAVATTRFREYLPFTDEDIDVYMERPWFSSGDGELLGVVLPQVSMGRRLRLTARAVGAAATPSASQLKPYVTQWGADPLWATTATTASPPPAAFRRAAPVERDLTLDELEGAKVTVVGHDVGYDRDRRLWYCDIEIDPGDSYYPFVRLALARYQPNSVKTPTTDVKLSRVVLADFAQLAPDRAATIAFDPRDARAVNVSLAGVAYRASGAGQGPSTVDVSVETRRPNVEGDLRWVPVPNSIVQLTSRILSDTRVLWTGKVTLPEERGSRPFRLIIKEYEAFVGDRPTSTRPTIAVIGGTERRLVYADAMDV